MSAFFTEQMDLPNEIHRIQNYEFTKELMDKGAALTRTDSKSNSRGTKQFSTEVLDRKYGN